MKSTAKVIAKPTTAKTIDLVRGMDATRNTSLYKMISTEVDKSAELGNARDQFYTKQYLIIADDRTVTMNKRKRKDNVVIKSVDFKSAKFTGLERDIVECLLAKYCATPHVISAIKDAEEIKLTVSAKDTTRIVAAMQMTDKETRALPATDSKYRIRVACQDWIRQVKHRLIAYCKNRMERENNALLGLNAKPTAKSKAKGKAKSKVDLANTGKGITLDMVKMYIQNGCAKLDKAKSIAYFDELENLIDSLREQITDGKTIQECEA